MKLLGPGIDRDQGPGTAAAQEPLSAATQIQQTAAAMAMGQGTSEAQEL